MSGLARLQADNLARTGRYGDTMLLHVSPSEVQGLDALAKSIGYEGLTTNPTTGLKEAFLFAPLLAPMLAGGLGGFTGTALGTGLLAGGLGAAEAAARGMDDPLKQGLMAGITAGGLSAIGDAASAATGGADAAAGAAGGAEALAAGAPSAATAPVAAGTGIETALPSAGAPSGAMGLGQGMTTGSDLGMQAQVSPLSYAGARQVPFAQGTAGAPSVQGTLSSAPAFSVPAGIYPPPPPAPGMFQQMGQNLASAPGRIMDTSQKLFESPEMMKTFMNNPATKMGGLAAMSGMMGSAGTEEQARAEEDARKEERAGAADMQSIRNRIIANYAAVGRQAPWMAAAGGLVPRYQEGGEVSPGRFLRGEGDGMSDGIQAVIDGRQPAALADGEFVVPADVVSALGNGSSEAGARVLEEMMRRVRTARTGTGEQAPEIDPEGMVPRMEDEEDED